MLKGTSGPLFSVLCTDYFFFPVDCRMISLGSYSIRVIRDILSGLES